MSTVDKQFDVITTSNLQTFFHESVSRAIGNQKVEAGEATICYLVNLLTSFSRSENFFEDTENGRGLRPLANLYAVAVESNSEVERKRVLQRLGDVALFVSGLFSDSFHRRLVDIDYYIAMGGSAYACLFESSKRSARDKALSAIFHQLGAHFARFVDVLAEVGEKAFGAHSHDLLRMHQIWEKTGSPRLEHKLKNLGVLPLQSKIMH